METRRGRISRIRKDLTRAERRLAELIQELRDSHPSERDEIRTDIRAVQKEEKRLRIEWSAVCDGRAA